MCFLAIRVQVIRKQRLPDRLIWLYSGNYGAQKDFCFYLT